MVFFCIYNILLYKYTGQEDIVVGSSCAGRPHSDLHNVIGFFINTLPIRDYPKGEKTFRQFLEEVKNNILKAVENQDYQFDDLVNRLGIQRDPSRQVLFDTHFTLHSVYFDRQGIEAGDGGGRSDTATNFDQYFVEEKITQFDIIVHAVEDNSGVSFSLRYCTKLFKKETMERFVGYYREITHIVAENKNIKLKDIKISHNLEAAQPNMPDADFIF
jgi:non-ribosomal peptide synthetase component F